MADIASEVRRLIGKRLDVAEERVKPEATFVADLGADSLALVELTLLFEEAFDIDIPDGEAEKLQTVQDAILCVEKHLLGQGHG